MATEPTRHTVTKAGGFTLIEMLIVIAVIVLLISILLPSLTMARENGWDVQCRSNMHRISQMMRTQGTTKQAGKYPDPSYWVSFVIGQGGGGLLRCPKDTREMGEQGVAALDDVYFVQVHKKDPPEFSPLTQILGSGQSEDKQMLLNPDWDDAWYPFSSRAREDNENIVCFDDDAACLITQKSDGWLFESIDPPGDTGCNSDHWLCKGPGLRDPVNWRDDIKMQLTGKHFKNTIDDPYFLKGGGWSSYGMNTQVPGRGARSGQVLLVEYHRSTVHVEGGGNHVDDFMDTEQYLAPRHLDKRHRANTAFVDGSVRAMLPDELDPENQPGNANIWTP